MNIQILNVKNCRYANKEGTFIDCDVNFDHLPQEYVPFTAQKNSGEWHVAFIYNNAVAGKYGPIAPYVEPVIPEFIPVIITMRQTRLQLLKQGLLDDVDPAIAAITDETLKRELKIEWEYSTEISNTGALANFFINGLGLTQDQLKDFFKSAYKL